MTINIKVGNGTNVVITEALALETLRLREAGEEINIRLGDDSHIIVSDE